METTSPNAKKIELVSVGLKMDESIGGVTVSEERIKELLNENGLGEEKK